MVRALARKARDPGFDPQLRCLIFFFPPSQCQCFLSSTGVLEWLVFTQSGSGLSCEIKCVCLGLLVCFIVRKDYDGAVMVHLPERNYNGAAIMHWDRCELQWHKRGEA